MSGSTWQGGAFGEAQDIEAIYDKFFKGGRSKAVIQQFEYTYQLETKNRKLNSFAQYAIDSLPLDLTSDYYDFIEAWGTHVSVRTEIGGMRERQVVLKDCMWKSATFTGGLDEAQIQAALRDELTGTTGEAFYINRRQVDYAFLI